MSRLNLLLADTDKWYLESLSSYIRHSFGIRFNVFIFSQLSTLMDFFVNSCDTAHILLISTDLYSDELQSYNAGLTILLTAAAGINNPGGLPSIDKYQPAEQLLINIMDLYSLSNPNVYGLINKGRKTCVLSVFSLQGGSGKTVISIYLARKLTLSGYRTLYLNLESINSTGFYLTSKANNESGLSNILYYLKNNRSNLPAKISNSAIRDDKLGFDYIKPCSSSLEIDELTDTETSGLLYEIKNTGIYDVIIVDTDSCFCKRSMAIMEESSLMLMVLTQDVILRYKATVFQHEIKKISPDFEEKIIGKTLTVINKYSSGHYKEDCCLAGQQAQIILPFLEDIIIQLNNKPTLNVNSSINIYIAKIMELISASLHPGGNGGSNAN